MSLKSSSALREKILQRVSTSLRTLTHGSSGGDLMQATDATILVFDEQICHLESGRSQPLVDSEPASLALGAANLLQGIEPTPSVLLLLPPSNYLATQIKMPGVASENLNSAIRLQSTVIVPGYDSELSFTVNTHSSTSDAHYVLWTNTQALDAYFEAFAEKGFFLAATLPRILCACANNTSFELLDEDKSALTHVICTDGAITHWNQVNKSDLSESHFDAQWQEDLQRFRSQYTLARNSSVQDYCDARDALPITTYAFVPKGAKAAAKKLAKGKRTVIAIAAAVIAAVLVASPFFFQSFTIKRLENKLAQAMEQSSVARNDQSIVREFEDSWGVLTEFPVQDVSTMLLVLQQELTPSVLSSLEVDEGKVEIEGESLDPQSLLERLEQNEAFAGVDFSRATNNNRYYIEMRLSTVDFDSYKQWYFPDVRR